MSVYTTEIASNKIPSDNIIHQRLLSAYHHAKQFIVGDLLELGCGEGRGIKLLAPHAKSYVGIDKNEKVVQKLKKKYNTYNFISGRFPPFPFEDNSFDTIITFHVIEHVKDDETFIKEVCRVLNPGGRALITTPNIKMTLSRNPWHEREYTGHELKTLCEKYFEHVEMKGISGNEKILEYHEKNRTSIQRIMRYDFLNLQNTLPASLLKIPYEILNRMNRNTLEKKDSKLVKSVTIEDFKLQDHGEQNLDLFCVLTK